MAIYKDGKKVFLLKDDHEVASISKNGTKVCGTKHENGLSPAYEQSVSDKAYPRATLYKVGGKSVKWNQGMPAVNATNYRANSATLNISGDVCTISNTTASYSGLTILNTSLANGWKANSKYYVSFDIRMDGEGTMEPTLAVYSTTYYYQNRKQYSGGNVWHTQEDIFTLNAANASNTIFIWLFVDRVVKSARYQVKNLRLINLTDIYGTGNEPTSTTDARIAELKAIAAAIPQYDAGSIKHAAVDIVRGDAPLIIPQAVRDLPDYGAGVGEVYNEIDMEPVVYHGLKAVDLGALNWTYNTTSWTVPLFYAYIGATDITDTANHFIPGLSGSRFSNVNTLDNKEFRLRAASGYLYIRNDAYTTAAAFKSSISGVILHYEATDGGTDYAARLYRHRVGKVVIDGVNVKFNAAWGAINNGYGVYAASGVQGFPSIQRVAIPGREPYMADTFTTDSIQSYRELPLYAFPSISGATTTFSFCLPSSVTSLAEANAWATAHPITMYYALPTEQVFDITPYFPAAPVVNVSAGGSVTFENEAKMPVPNKIQYIVQDV